MLKQIQYNAYNNYLIFVFIFSYFFIVYFICFFTLHFSCLLFYSLLHFSNVFNILFFHFLFFYIHFLLLFHIFWWHSYGSLHLGGYAFPLHLRGKCFTILFYIIWKMRLLCRSRILQHLIPLTIYERYIEKSDLVQSTLFSLTVIPGDS